MKGPLTSFGSILPVVVYSVVLSLVGTRALLAISERRARDEESVAVSSA